MKEKSNIKEINNQIDIETLKKENHSLKEKIDALRNENNSFLYSALCKFQNEMHIVSKDSKAFGSQTYASWEQIKKLVTPVLAKYSICVLQEPITLNGTRNLKTTIAHSSGQKSISVVEIPEYIAKDSRDPKKEWSSSLSFFKRHIFLTILGIATQD